MADITAKDIMKSSFLRLGENHLLREALGIVLESQARNEEMRTLIVLHPDGSFAGVLSVHHFLRAVLPEWVHKPEEFSDERAFEIRLVASLPDRLNLKVRDAMDSDVPPVGPDDRLLRLIELMRDKRAECLPVLDNGRVIGIVYLTDVFNAAAQLALTS